VRGQIGLGWVGSGQVSDAQRIMCNGAIIPHDFKKPSRFYHRVQEVKMYEFGVITHGITSTTNLIYFRPGNLQLSNSS
jgi:hypothetical protein